MLGRSFQRASPDQSGMGEGTLTPRERHVLKYLIEHYLETGRPVGSRILARICNLGLSPATIRNTVADLEAKGFVRSPHTSAGRVPTRKGYRYFLDQLLAPSPPQDRVVEQLWNDFERQTSPQRLLETACQLLARLTHLVGVATLPHAQHLTVDQLELIPLGEKRLLLLLITSDGEVISGVVSPRTPLSQREVARLGERLGRRLRGRPLAEIARLVRELEDGLHRLETLQFEEVVETALRKRTVVAGEINLFDFPEASHNPEQLRSLYRFLKDEELLDALLENLNPSRPSVFLGEELRSTLKACSVVAQTHPLGGMIGVVGPVRMDYARIVPLVETTTRLLHLALRERRSAP